MAHDEPRFFQPGGEARGRFQRWLDALEPRGDAEGPGVEAPREERAGAGVDLAQAGRAVHLDHRVIRPDGERAGLALDVERLWRGERDSQRRGLDGLLGEEREGVGLFHRLGEIHREQLPAGGDSGGGGGFGDVPVADAVALHARERVARRQADREARDAGLEQLVAQRGGELDDGGRNLRGGGGVHGDEGLARNLRGLALPAQRDDAVRADHTSNGGTGLRRAIFDERAAEEFDFNAGVALGLEAGGRGGRAGEGDVVPRLGLGDAGDDLELERVDAGLGAVEAIGTRACADGLQPPSGAVVHHRRRLQIAGTGEPHTRRQVRREDRDVALEENRADFIGCKRLDLHCGREARLRVGDFAVVAHLADDEVGVSGGRGGRGLGEDFRRTRAAREDLQAVQHRDAGGPGQDRDDDGFTREHRHVAEHDELPAFLPTLRNLPAGRRARTEWAEDIRAGVELEEGILLRAGVGVGVAVEVELVAAGFEAA